MKALVKTATGVQLLDTPEPSLGSPSDVKIRVRRAGLCRTDVHVAAGRIACVPPLILGHEFAGTVCQVGADVKDLRRGQAVTANPAIPCGACATCQDKSGACPQPRWLGIDRDGAFAECIVVPQQAVLPLPADLPWTHGAYTEPVAAALATVGAGLPRAGVGLLVGRNRIARLTERVLALHGYPDVTLCTPMDLHTLAAGSVDFIVESDLSAESLTEMIRVVRVGGTLVLKSRPASPMLFDVRAAVHKDIHLRALNHGNFAHAIDLLASQRIELDDLLGPSVPLSHFETVFAEAEYFESAKVFFDLGDAE